MLTGFIEQKPLAGIFASLTGLGVSVLSWLQGASIVLGFCGALFGLAAGYYTFRIKRRHWLRVQSDNL